MKKTGGGGGGGAFSDKKRGRRSYADSSKDTPPMMTKKNSSQKKLKHSNEGSSAEQQKPSLKPKKMGSEIDEIFARKKRKRPENNEKKANAGEKPIKVSSGANAKSKDKMGMVRNDGKKSRSLKENGLVERTSRSRKRTADGLSLYTEEELGFGKADAGGTRLCPFDCDCCF